MRENQILVTRSQTLPREKTPYYRFFTCRSFINSVSYTHLRAHETRHEKEEKKNKLVKISLVIMS